MDWRGKSGVTAECEVWKASGKHDPALGWNKGNSVGGSGVLGFMTKFLASLCCVLMLAGWASAEEKPWVAGKSAHASFPARGMVILHLGAGDATVIENPNAKEIVITTETRAADKVNSIRASVNAAGSTADVIVDGPNNFRYRIELPTAADLKVRMSAGDLTIDGVDGNTDVELHAGDCNISLATAPENFGPIDMSVKAGDLSSGPFGASKGGLFRHFHLNRIAKYKFHAHVGAGDLVVK